MTTTATATAIRASRHLPPLLAWPAFGGGLLALGGTYWDDAWHTDRGRDDFFIAPHLVLYGGVLVAAVAVGLWLVRAARGSSPIPALRATAPLRWAVVAVGAVFVSAPIDNAWHALYGRDAVLFSPPHLLAIVGSATLVVALASGLGPPTGRLAPGSWALRSLGGALVLGALLVPVMEYETDVPQFSPAWFLPLVTVAVILARPVAASLLPGRWPLTQATAVYTVIRLALLAVLAAGGFSTPIVPPVLLAVAVADLAIALRWPWPAQAVAVAAAVHVAYLPWLAVVPNGVPVTGRALLLSAATAVPAAFVAHLALRPDDDWRRPIAAVGLGTTAVVVVLAGLLLPARPAAAHDPGQGQRRGDAELTTTVTDRTVHLVATVDGVDCRSLQAPIIVARRAGMTRSAALVPTGRCRYQGQLAVPQSGRWFVYAGFTDHDHAVEAWLPVEVADGTHTTDTRDLYQPPGRSGTPATQVLAGTALLAAAAVLLVGCLRMAARPTTMT